MGKQEELLDVETDEVGKKALTFIAARDKRDEAETKRRAAEVELIEALKAAKRKTIKLEGRTLRLSFTPSKENINVETK